jgi:hypothetical protein
MFGATGNQRQGQQQHGQDLERFSHEITPLGSGAVMMMLWLQLPGSREP